MIIFINGSINSGKSTLAKMVATAVGNCALLEIDKLHEFIEWMSIDKAVQLNLKNAISVIKNFANEGLNIVIPYPLSEKNFNYVKESLAEVKTEIYYFTLAPKLEEVLKNRGERKLDDWERSRIKHHYEIGINKPSFGVVIDNTQLTPEETLQRVITNIKG